MLHEDGGQLRGGVAEMGEVGELDLQQVGAGRQFRDQGAQGAGSVLAHLGGKRCVAQRLFVPVHHVDFAEHFVELVVFDRLVGFAETGEQEIHAAGERPAEIPDAHGAAVGEGLGEVGRDKQDRGWGTGGWGMGKCGDAAAGEVGLRGPRARRAGSERTRVTNSASS